MKLLTKLLFTLLLLCLAPTVFAQDACPAIVSAALDATQNACDATGRNQVCYGNVLLNATPQTGAAAFTFAKPGDKADVGGVQSLTLSTMNTADQQWGVALMKLQANLPDTLPGQNVTVVLFGDVAIQNEGTSAAQPTATPAPPATPTPVLIGVTPSNKINVRSAPSTSASVVSSIPKGDTLQADGRTDAGDWLHVDLGGGQYGWVFAQLVKADSDVSVLPVMTGDASSSAEAAPTEAAAAPIFGPMQAFYFTSGANDAPCAQAPDSGILIQTPEGAGKINLDVNDVSIQLGSTAYLQAQKSGNMTVSVIEGQGIVTAQGVTVTVPAGSQVIIPLDANGLASGAPVGPQPYDNAKLAPLPISLLGRSITIAPALTADQIQTLTAQLAYQDQNKNWHAVACFTDGVSFPAALNTPNYAIWKAESGVTVAVTVPGDTSTDQGDAIHHSKIAFYALPSTNPNDPPFAYSGNDATLSYTFAQETMFLISIVAAPTDQPIVTVTC